MQSGGSFGNLAAPIPDKVEIKVVNGSNGETRDETIKIQYDILLKYCRTCKLQGHNEVECGNIHPGATP